jgi:alpha-mannosidase
MAHNRKSCLPAFLALTALVSVVTTVVAGETRTPPAIEANAPPAMTLEVVPTPLLIRVGGATKEIVLVKVESPGQEAAAALQVSLGGKPVALEAGSLHVVPGSNLFEAAVPEVAAPTAARFVLTVAPGSRPASTAAPSKPRVLIREVTLAPARRWSVYLFHHSHTDIGYTELQSRVGQNHLEYLDSVIDYCRQTDAYPDDAKFRWNMEVSWAFQYYRAMRPEARFNELVGLIKSGRVEMSGLQLNISDCYGHEELIRAVEYPAELGRRYGFPVRAAMNDDVTGFGWALPQIFSQNGVRYFSTGVNETRSRAPLRRPCPFWWESPDGSRVLEWNGEHYLFANYELLLHEPLARSAPRLGEYLAKLGARGDYPYDLIAFNISAWVTDNCPPGRGLSDRVKEWNEHFVSPRLRLATLHEFFERMEKEYGPRIPVHKLGWPDYWTDGVGSTAFETGLNRLTHGELITAEKVSALAAKLVLDQAKAYGFPGDAIHETYDLSMLYDEHTWGAWNSIDDPWSEMARGQWTLKSSFAYRAREAARTLARRGMEALAKLISAEGDYEFVVFNPLSWPRTDVVTVTLPAGPLREAKGRLRVVDRRTGSAAKFQMIGEGTVMILAPNVPSMGYAVFAVEPPGGPEAAPGGAPAAPPGGPAASGNAIENRFYRVTVDPQTGGISRLLDKETGREIVDASCSYPLNAYIYEQPEGGRKAVDNMGKRAAFRRSTAASAKIERGWRGPLAESLVVTSAPRMCRSLEQRIILYDDFKRIDLVNVLDKEETFDPEAVYFAFPFAVGPGLPGAFSEKGGPAPAVDGGRRADRGISALPGPSVRFEIADGDMAPESEQLPGTTRDWLTVQHWVEFSGKDARVVWSPVEAPLVQFGDINTGKWLTKLDLVNAWVFSYAMNNYWMTNFKASQEGRVQFRYSLTSLPADADEAASGSGRVASSRFGWDVHTPLAAAWLPAKNRGRFKTPSESLISVDEPNVIIQALWLDAEGTPVVRLREIAGRATDARLRSAAFLGFTVTTSLGSRNTTVESMPVHLKAFEIQTVRVSK